MQLIAKQLAWYYFVAVLSNVVNLCIDFNAQRHELLIFASEVDLTCCLPVSVSRHWQVKVSCQYTVCTVLYRYYV